MADPFKPPRATFDEDLETADTSLAIPKVRHEDDLFPRERVGNHEIEHLHRVGGFASVYRARHLSLNQVRAIKVLHRKFLTSADATARFQREAEAIIRLRHPNIVELFDAGELPDGRPYIAMEWLDGRTLEDLVVERGALPPKDALTVITSLGSALAAVHDAGMVHRDLKASNVIALQDGLGYRVKLLDFGLVKVVEGDAAPGPASMRTSQGTVLGTPDTMAPEQLLAGPTDARTDIYALGTLLFQLLTGHLPFRGATFAELQDQQLNAPPPRVSAEVPVPELVDTIIQRSMAKQPADRYPNVRAFLEDVRSAATNYSSGPRKSEAPTGVAVHVEIRCDAGDEASDEALDQLDAALVVARELFSSAQLQIAMESPGVLVGAALVPTDPQSAQAVRRAAILTGVKLRDALAQQITDETLHFSVCAHAAPVVVRPSGNELRFVGGELLRVGGWAMEAPDRMFAASEAALHQLFDDIESKPLESRSDFHLVIRPLET